MEQVLMLSRNAQKPTVNTTTENWQLEQSGVSSEFSQEKKKLRVLRTKKYVKLMKEIDSLSEKDKQIIDMVQSMPLNNKLIGILSTCCLQGCIIHAIDKWGNILEHFTDENEMTADLQEGYQIYKQNKDCASVEIYTHTICVVYGDGTVKVIERGI